MLPVAESIHGQSDHLSGACHIGFLLSLEAGLYIKSEFLVADKLIKVNSSQMRIYWKNVG